jgi:GNAT superfamily N-acetyltransferase
MIVRDLAPDDRAAWGGLWAGYLAFYQSELDPSVTETTWSRLLDPKEPMFALVAEGEAGLIGFSHCVLHRGTWSIGDFCYLEDLFVTEQARGLGVGRALIEAVYARADALKCGRVYWLTHDTNYDGRRLYDRLARNTGFIQYRRP